MARRHRELAFLFCPDCRGVWLTRDNFRHLRELTVDPSWQPRLPETGLFVRRPRIVEGAARCVCAEGPLMDAVDEQGVVVDVCPSCSAVWLDGREIQKIYYAYRGKRISYFDLGQAILRLVDRTLFRS